MDLLTLIFAIFSWSLLLYVTTSDLNLRVEVRIKQKQTSLQDINHLK